MKSVMHPKTVVHRAEARGYADHGWLKSRFSFSFAEYYDPERMGFGALRVINDDIIAGGSGFGMHPHQNMEIVSIPLIGAIRHEDDMGHTAIIQAGDVQVMSAGTGVLHSEYNADETVAGQFLQIWILPREQGVAPRYDQTTLHWREQKNIFQEIVSSESGAGVWIHQDAWLSLGVFSRDEKIVYQMKRAGNGLYVFVIAGNMTVAGEVLGSRDGCGVWGTDTVSFEISAGAEVLLLDVPMMQA